MSNAVWQYTAPGRLSTTLTASTRPIPTPGPGEVVVGVKAAALNPVDEQLAQSSPRLLKFIGATEPSETSPLTPSSDFAGVITAVGDGVTQFTVGDEVYGQRFSADGNGFLAEYVCIPASAPFIHKPAGLDWAQAAAVPLVYSTVYDALVVWGRLPFDPTDEDKAKQRTVLVLGGSSGTGSAAIQLARKMGLRVAATCSAANAELVKSLGAEEVIDYTTEDVTARALASPLAPFAEILDCVGGTDLVPHLDALILADAAAPQLGVYVTIVGDKTSRDAMGGAVTNLYYPAQAIRTLKGVVGEYLPNWIPGPLRSLVAGKRYACIRLVPTKDKLATYESFMAAGGKITLDSTHEFAQAKAAYERLESGRARGKVVVQVAK